MATELGTAFVSVKPDFSAFDRLVAQKLGRSFASVGEQSGRDFNKGFNEHASGVLVPFQAALRDVARDSKGVNGGLASTEKALDKIAKTAERANKSLGKFDGSRALAARTDAAKAAKAALADAAPVVDISPVARVDAKLAGADAEITAMQRHLAELRATPNPSLEVQIKIAKAIGALEAVEARRSALAKQRTELVVDVDRRAFNAAFAELNKLQDVRKLPSIVPSPVGPALADLNARIARRGTTPTTNPAAVIGAASFGASRAAAEAAGAAAEVAGQKIAEATAEGSKFANLDKTARLDLSIAGAEAKLQQITTEIDRLTALPQSVEVLADIRDVTRKFDRVEAERDKLIAKRAELTVAVKGLAEVDAELERLALHKAELSARPATIEVQTQIAEALAEMALLEAEKKRLSATKVHIEGDVDRSIGTRLSEIAASAKGLTAAFGGGGLGDATTRVSLGFLSFGASLTPLVGLIAAAAVAIGVSLVGALAALASSLALAAAGAGALGLALGGILGASLGLIIPVAVRLAKVFESLKADNAVTDAIGRNSAAGAQAAAAAVKQQEAAARGLTDANRQLSEAAAQVGIAEKAAYREMADAADKAADSVRGVTEAQDGLASAKLSIRESENELQKFRDSLGATGEAFGAVFQKFTDVSVDTSGLRAAVAAAANASEVGLSNDDELKLERLILNVRDAKNREKDAIDGVKDATREEGRAQSLNNDFKREGIRASATYQAALKAEAAAQRGVANAKRAVDDAKDAGATGAVATAQAKSAQLTGRLTKAEVGLKNAVHAVGVELRGAFTPASNAVIRGLTTGLLRVPRIVNPLRGAIGRLGVAWQTAIDTFSADLIRPDSIAKFKAFTDGAAELAGPVTRGLSAFLDILTDIGRAALPFLVSGTKKVADQLEDWAKSTSNTKKLSSVIGGLVGHLKTWLRLGAAIADVFLAFFPAAAGSGKGLAERITQIARGMAAWIRSDAGRKRIAKFFADTMPLAGQVARFIGRMTLSLIVFGQKAAPILSDVFSAFGKVSLAVQGVIHWFGEHKTAATVLLGVLGGFTAAFAAYALGAGIAVGVTALLSGAIGVLTAIVFANPIGLAAAAIVGLGAALVIAYKRSETFRKVVGAAVDFVKKHWEELLVVLGGPFGVAALIAIKKFDTIKAAASGVIDFIRDHWKVIFVLLTGPFGAAALFIAGQFDTIKSAGRTLLRFLIGVFDKIAGGFSSMLTALSHVPKFGWARTAANDIDGARAALRKLSKGLDDIPADKKVKLHLTLTPESRKALEALNKLGSSVGGPTGTGRLARATGGIIPGYGTADNVPLWGTPGEFMVKRVIVGRLTPAVMTDINEGRLDPRVGYEPGQRPSVGTVRARGPKLATGGLVGAAVAQRPNVTTNIDAHISTPGGGAPDERALAVRIVREVESRINPPHQD